MEGRHFVHEWGASVQRYAKIAGVLGLVSVIAGGFGEFYVPSRLIVSGDATATASNIISSDLLFRVGFAAYLVEAVCDVALTLVLYVLLRPVRKDLALLASFFRLLGTALYGVAELFYVGALVVLGGANYMKTFSPDQLNTLALLSLNLYRYWSGMFAVFSGVAYILIGYLIFRSRYLPKVLGVVLALAGVAFVASNFMLVLAPAYASSILLLPVVIAAVSLTGWLVVKGVDVPKWEQKVLTRESVGGQ